MNLVVVKLSYINGDCLRHSRGIAAGCLCPDPDIFGPMTPNAGHEWGRAVTNMKSPRDEAVQVSGYEVMPLLRTGQLWAQIQPG